MQMPVQPNAEVNIDPNNGRARILLKKKRWILLKMRIRKSHWKKLVTLIRLVTWAIWLWCRLKCTDQKFGRGCRPDRCKVAVILQKIREVERNSLDEYV